MDTHVYIEIRLGWIWNHISSWDRTKIIVLLLFQLPTLLNSQNTYDIQNHNELWHINL